NQRSQEETQEGVQRPRREPAERSPKRPIIAEAKNGGDASQTHNIYDCLSDQGQVRLGSVGERDQQKRKRENGENQESEEYEDVVVVPEGFGVRRTRGLGCRVGREF